MNEISRNFGNEISRKKMNKISRNFAKFLLRNFHEIPRNEIHFRTYFVFREIKKIDFRDHPTSVRYVLSTYGFSFFNSGRKLAALYFLRAL
jgi:hypothetical protein